MFIAREETAPVVAGSPAGHPTGRPASSPATDARTRDRVRETISAHGPISAVAIAGRLGLTPAAVRRHLDALAEQGAIQEREQATAGRGRGRPARAYVLAEAGHASMGTAYDELAGSALRYLADSGGEDAVVAFAKERMARFEERYAAEMAAATDTASRTAALAAALSADGFAASTRPVAEGTPLAGMQLCQGHCPVKHAAEQFPQLCEAETDAFSRLLGVHVQRLATLAHGEHVCTTFVPAQRTATAAPRRPIQPPTTTPTTMPTTMPTSDLPASKERDSR